LKYSTNTIHD